MQQELNVPSPVLPFTREARRGRKRVSQSIREGGGEVSLLMLTRSGVSRPANVVSLADEKARSVYVDRADAAMMMALAVFNTLTPDQRRSVRAEFAGLRHAKDPYQRALGMLGLRVIGTNTIKQAFSKIMFINELTGEVVYGEPL